MTSRTSRKNKQIRQLAYGIQGRHQESLKNFSLVRPPYQCGELPLTLLHSLLQNQGRGLASLTYNDNPGIWSPNDVKNKKVFEFIYEVFV